jgi:hypothetical protein
MLHWFPAPSVAFAGARASGAALPGEPRSFAPQRAQHALMLAYAAQRRRAAAGPSDPRYWKAAAPVALDKAKALRTAPDFPELP